MPAMKLLESAYWLMRLSQFIQANVDAILEEWEAFARTMLPPASTMSASELRNHARDILMATAAEMDLPQTAAERHARSQGQAPAPAEQSYPTLHGILRQRSGFDLIQLGAEFRALRAVVLRLWHASVDVVDADVLEQVMRLNESIDQAMAESLAAYSERVANSRDTFLAVLGHDLRNPLSALDTCIQLLGRAEARRPPEATLLVARRSLTAINAMVTDLLEYTKTRLGRGIEVVPADGDFSSLCREALDEVCAAYPTRSFVADIAPLPALRFDASRMRQVIINLLSNAVHHGDPQAPVELSVLAIPDGVELVVRNEGQPIPPQAMQVIFNPLVQITAEEALPGERPATSLGLGLFIAREIVTGHNGRISVASSAADGTAFTVQLPR